MYGDGCEKFRLLSEMSIFSTLVGLEISWQMIIKVNVYANLTANGVSYTVHIMLNKPLY